MDLSLGMLTLGASQVVVGALTVLFLFCSVLLILTVLIQRPQGGGLSGAFGGGGSAGGETAFGARTGDALTMATIGFFVLWLVIAVGLVLIMRPSTAAPAGPAATSQGMTTPEDAAQEAQNDAVVNEAEGNTETPAPEGDAAETGDDQTGTENTDTGETGTGDDSAGNEGAADDGADNTTGTEDTDGGR